jgi:hypothetical protein
MFFNVFGTHQVFPHDGIDIACDSFAAGGVHAPPSSQTCFMPTPKRRLHHAMDRPRFHRPAFRLRDHDVHRQPLICSGSGPVHTICSKCERGENSANRGARRRSDRVSDLGVQRRVALLSPLSLRVAAKKAMRGVARPGRGETPAAACALRMSFLIHNASWKNRVNRP